MIFYHMCYELSIELSAFFLCKVYKLICRKNGGIDYTAVFAGQTFILYTFQYTN